MGHMTTSPDARVYVFRGKLPTWFLRQSRMISRARTAAMPHPDTSSVGGTERVVPPSLAPSTEDYTLIIDLDFIKNEPASVCDLLPLQELDQSLTLTHNSHSLAPWHCLSHSNHRRLPTAAAEHLCSLPDEVSLCNMMYSCSCAGHWPPRSDRRPKGRKSGWERTCLLVTTRGARQSGLSEM